MNQENTDLGEQAPLPHEIEHRSGRERESMYVCEGERKRDEAPTARNSIAMYPPSEPPIKIGFVP
jgi:hypothetical protein